MNVIFNNPSILEKISRSKRLSSTILARAKQKVETAKTEMIAEFDEHEVTQEIERGPGTDNSTGILKGVIGDLYSFFGFEKGTSPTVAIKNALIKFTRIKTSSARVNRRGNKTQYTYSLQMPSEKDIFSIGAEDTPQSLGGSWVKHVEDGVRGLKYYLSIEGIHDLRTKNGRRLKKAILKKSRSGEALQLNITGGRKGVSTTKKTDYISTILNNFKRKFRNSVFK